MEPLSPVVRDKGINGDKAWGMRENNLLVPQESIGDIIEDCLSWIIPQLQGRGHCDYNWRPEKKYLESPVDAPI